VSYSRIPRNFKDKDYNSKKGFSLAEKKKIRIEKKGVRKEKGRGGKLGIFTHKVLHEMPSVTKKTL